LIEDDQIASIRQGLALADRASEPVDIEPFGLVQVAYLKQKMREANDPTFG
jgi:hypothetical protein